MNKFKNKFKIGEEVQVRADLKVGKRYVNKNSPIGDIFSERMRKNLGKKGKIINIVEGKYVLDIDKIHAYTDGMLEYPCDKLAKEKYGFNLEVENLISHVNKQFHYNLIDKALDERLHETNPEAFKKIVENYNRIN